MRRISIAFMSVAVSVLTLQAVPALADHTNPREPLSETEGTPADGITRGEGTWEFLVNFAPNPGTDLQFFKKKGRVYSSSGTLGQADAQHVGQRILRLVTRKGKVKPKWVADHGSANCPTANPSGTTGLQHDVQVTTFKNPKLLIDTTDATGRCHDPDGGGLELVDISKIHKKKFEPREIHLTRHEGTSHNSTVDATRPWIVYNSSSQSTAAPWIDVVDIKSCLGKGSLKAKRAACRPKVYRIMFQPEWTQRIDAAGERIEGTESSCHDITAVPGRLYCANLNSTIILDVSDLTDPKTGKVRGKPLKCEVVDGTNTKAKVTDCSQPVEGTVPEATGWEYIGHVNHPGRNGSHNTNTEYESVDGIAVSHEADPSHDGNLLFVTDERGGGVVPGGSSCSPNTPNPYGNGGVHAFDISDPANIQYAPSPDEEKAVFISEPVVPAPSFCTAHVMELLPDEQRFVIAWYSQGVKIVDYFTDANGAVILKEVASYTLPNANTWAAEPFKIVANEDGSVTYYFLASDIERGIDIFTWTGPPNPIGTPPPAQERVSRAASLAPTLGVYAALAGALAMGRRRRRAG